jgi:hypothetical protein
MLSSHRPATPAATIRARPAAGAVEIGGGVLDKAHAFAEQRNASDATKLRPKEIGFEAHEMAILFGHRPGLPTAGARVCPIAAQAGRLSGSAAQI